MRSLAFKETAFELRSGSLASIGEITTRACSYRAGVSRTIGRFFWPERAAEIVLHFNNRMDTNRTISLGNSRFMPKPNKQIFSRARFGRQPNPGLHVFSSSVRQPIFKVACQLTYVGCVAESLQFVFLPKRWQILCCVRFSAARNEKRILRETQVRLLLATN